MPKFRIRNGITGLQQKSEILLPLCKLHHTIPSQTGGEQSRNPSLAQSGPPPSPTRVAHPSTKGPSPTRAGAACDGQYETLSLPPTLWDCTSTQLRGPPLVQTRISFCAEKLVLWPKTTQFYDCSTKSAAMARGAGDTALSEHLANELSEHELEQQLKTTEEPKVANAAPG